MTTTLNNNAPVRDLGYPVEHVVRKSITFADTSSFTITGIPAEANVLAGQITITTAFDNTSTVLSVGYSDATASNPSAYASSIATTASTVFDDVLTAGAKPLSRATNVVGILHSATSTAGAADVVVRFITQSSGEGSV